MARVDYTAVTKIESSRPYTIDRRAMVFSHISAGSAYQALLIDQQGSQSAHSGVRCYPDIQGGPSGVNGL